MKDKDRIAALEARVAKIEGLLVGDPSVYAPALTNPFEETAAHEMVRRLRKQLRAARARASKPVGEGRGHLTEDAKAHAKRELRSIMIEIVRLEEELGSGSETDGE